jgi:MFS transporter, DHA2 family, multidrug resistance protein
MSPEASASAQDTLGGAVAVAGTLPDALGAALLDSARDAFIQGMQLTASIGAVVMAGTAILAVILLRQAHPTSAAEAEMEPEPERAVVTPANRPRFMPCAAPAD